MPVVDKVNFLYTNIGRGHPFYLDGILEALVRRGYIGLVRGETDVFEVSGGVSRMVWRMARYLYEKGSSGGWAGWVYRRLREDGDYNHPSLGLRLMGRDVVKRYGGEDTPLIVAHPSLVGILRGRRNVLYQHGEVVAPDEALALDAEYVFVPTERVAEEFMEVGYHSENLIVTGLCIEPPLVKQAKDSYDLRRQRYLTREPLTGAYFSSGAEPDAHVNRLIDTAAAVCDQGSRVVIFARKGGKLARLTPRRFAESGLAVQTLDGGSGIPLELPPALLVEYSGRREENQLTAQLFPNFDYLVAPAHERTNWALGLGLPMFIVQPYVGPFAPLNGRLLVKQGVAQELESFGTSQYFARALRRMRKDGILQEMAENGWQRFSIQGFFQIADFLHDRYGTAK